MRCETADRNLRKSLGPQESLSNISAARQCRLDEVQRRFEAGESPTEIAKALGHKHQFIYQDLKALGIDPKESKAATQATAAREQLLERIATLIESGLQHNEVAPLVNLSTAMVGYHARKLVAAGRLTHTSIVRKRKAK